MSYPIYGYCDGPVPSASMAASGVWQSGAGRQANRVQLSGGVAWGEYIMALCSSSVLWGYRLAPGLTNPFVVPFQFTLLYNTCTQHISHIHTLQTLLITDLLTPHVIAFIVV